MIKTQTAAAMLLAATAIAQTYPAGSSIGVTGFDNVRLTLFNATPTNAVAPSCTVTAGLANVTPGATLVAAPSLLVPEIALPGSAGMVAAGPLATIGFSDDWAATEPPAPVKMTLAPGQAATIDYYPALAPGVRQQLRPDFNFSNGLACSGLAATVELFDSTTARTTILYPARPMLPMLGAAGITKRDTIRLNLAAHLPNHVTGLVPLRLPNPATPCHVQTSFLTLNSSVPLAENTFTILPGQSAALEFSNAALPAGTRQTVLPVVRTLNGLASCLGLQANLELYDSVSTRTFAFLPPSPMLIQ